ncbi:hypothetical protein ROZALSC1DRAFT_29292, partial [Rozella allomycis CSF55]
MISILKFLSVKPQRATGLANSILSATQVLKINNHKFPCQEKILHKNDLINVITNLTSFKVKEIELSLSVLRHSRSFCIIIGGTSGTGKSTISSLLASRMNISTVLSTDHIRNIQKSCISKADDPILHKSSYEAYSTIYKDAIPKKDLIIEGFEMQSGKVVHDLPNLIKTFINRGESVIVEGVNFSIQNILQFFRSEPKCIPFLVYISNPVKHLERFAVRAKYMTLEPRRNRYVENFENIRVIHDYLCSDAAENGIPAVDNTNIDRSLAIIHETVLKYLLDFQIDFKMFEERLKHLNDSLRKVYERHWSSKPMLQLIK